MDFRVSREAFLRVLTHVSSIVDSRSTIPILSNIYIKCDNNKIEITAIEIIDADYFVTGDNEGRIMLWKLNRVLPDFKNSTLTYIMK